MVCVPVATGVKQQRRVWRDTDIADGKEQGACGLAVAVDAKALAGGVILLHDCIEARHCARRARSHAHAQS